MWQYSEDAHHVGTDIHLDHFLLLAGESFIVVPDMHEEASPAYENGISGRTNEQCLLCAECFNLSP